jgi:uncharacterized protein (DUF885 family)
VRELKLPAAREQALIAEGRAAMTGPFRRGYDRVLAALQQTAPKATSNDGVWRLPNGAAYYDQQLLFWTTTEMTADQIHTVGVAEVARIQREMEAIKAKVGFTGSLQAFFENIKTGGQFHYPNTPEGKAAYLADAKTFIAGAMAEAPQYFRVLPRAALDVRAVEPWREASAPVAFYNRSTPDGSRPGIFYVNLADMSQVLKPQVEGIAYHEGAPGHHFQLALSQETQGLPKFRRFGFYGAYIEDGAFTPSGSARRWASTRTLTATSVASRWSSGAPPGWWSTPACTASAGRANRASPTSRRTPFSASVTS